MREPTESEVNQACMNYNHAFGLMSDEERRALAFEAREWLQAWMKVVDAERVESAES